MTKIKVELVKYDTGKTSKRKRANLLVDSKNEEAVIKQLTRIHKGDAIKTIHEIIWSEEAEPEKKIANIITGRVKFYDEEKGYGFIEPDVSMADLFFHTTALAGETLYEGDVVEFEISEGPKGLIAIHIKLLDEKE